MCIHVGFSKSEQAAISHKNPPVRVFIYTIHVHTICIYTRVCRYTVHAKTYTFIMHTYYIYRTYVPCVRASSIKVEGHVRVFIYTIHVHTICIYTRVCRYTCMHKHTHSSCIHTIYTVHTYLVSVPVALK